MYAYPKQANTTNIAHGFTVAHSIRMTLEKDFRIRVRIPTSSSQFASSPWARERVNRIVVADLIHQLPFNEHTIYPLEFRRSNLLCMNVYTEHAEICASSRQQLHELLD